MNPKLLALLNCWNVFSLLADSTAAYNSSTAAYNSFTTTDNSSTTANKTPTQKCLAATDFLPVYISTTACAGVLLLILFASVIFLVRRVIQRQGLKTTCQATVEDYEQPRYENIRDPFTYVTASASRDVGHEATILMDNGREEAQNSPIYLNPYNLDSSISNVGKKSKWSATNSSMKESSFHDDSSDSISLDDSGKDSGSLYIAPSHRTSSSEEPLVDIKLTRYKRQRPSDIPRQQPAVGRLLRQTDAHAGNNKLYQTSPSEASRTKHRVHVTWKDSQQHIKNITEELNNRQQNIPNCDDGYYRYPLLHPTILSRNFTSQQTLALKAQFCYNSKRVDNNAPQPKSHDKKPHFYSESDLDDICSLSTSINRFSTVAYANVDVTRASACSSSSLDGGHGLNMFKRHSVMCFLDTSYMSSVSKRSDAV